MMKLTINDRQIEANKNDTVLTAAIKAGIEIPTLCYHPDIEPSGGCRLCIVKIDGIKGFPTSCTTPVKDGMVVYTETPEIVELRKNILKLLLSNHTSPCLVCLHKELCEKYRPNPTKSGKATRCAFCSNRETCILRVFSDKYEVHDLDMPIIYHNLPLERMDPFMDRDYNLCVLCGRCVRICKQLHGKSFIDFQNRGSLTRVGTIFNKDHIESGCVFCGACIDICPTGALSDRFAKWYGSHDKTIKTTCILCPIGCELNLKIKNNKVISASALDFTKESQICAVGRFVLPQIFDSPVRIKNNLIKQGDAFKKLSYADTIDEAVKKLKNIKGEEFALIAYNMTSREEIFILKKFTNEVMKSENFILIKEAEEKININKNVKAVLLIGNYPDFNLFEKLDVKIIIGCFKTDLLDKFDIFFAGTVPGEEKGTFLNSRGEIRNLSDVIKLPEQINPAWKIICDIAIKFNAESFNYNNIDEITKEIQDKKITFDKPAHPKKSPIENLSAIPKYFHGYLLSDIACALQMIFNKEYKEQESAKKGFKILEREEVVPNTYLLTIYSPEIAKKCRPGQFIIAMASEKSERIPYTICDWDADKGTVVINVIEAGRSTREMSLLNKGDALSHFAGPLGTPIEIKKYGTVVCAGGCFGVGAIFPLIKSLKEAGNKVITIEEASSHYLLYWEKKLAEFSDEFIVVTKDGSKGMKGGIQEVISMLTSRGEKIDMSFIIGCTFMMMMVSEETKKHNIPTMVALNPIMLDGTGMCGACRVTMGDKTKFVCVDGPFLDGHKIDWDELFKRRSAYYFEEIDSMPQDNKFFKHICRNI